MRLRVLDGRDAEFLLEHAAQVAIGDAERCGEIRKARVGEPAVLDQARGRLREAAVGVHRRESGGELGTASQAGPKSLRLGGRGAREIAAILAKRHARGAHRPAIDSRGPHPNEEAPVEAGVVGAQRAVALIGI